MLKYILKKLLAIIPMLLLLSVIVYVAIWLTPADPVNYMVSPDMYGSGNLELLREQLGLDDPIYMQYFRWLGGILRGDFGYSLVQGVPISRLIGRALPATFELAICALILSTILSITIGFFAAVKKNTWIDYLCSVTGVVGVSIPQFFFGICLISIFALNLGWVPVGGRLVVGVTSFWGRLPNLILPTLAMSISMTAVLMRYTRNSMLDVLNKDYIKTARSKGIPEWKVFIKHAFRNSLTPVLTILCFRLPMLIGGSVVIESVFSWPGLGTIIKEAVSSGDYPLILITTMMVACAMLVASFLVDVLTAALDPRVRLE